MYLCPRCEHRYEQAPEQCQECKRPLILNKRYRIEASIQTGLYGEDFDVLDLKSQKSMIVREFRVKKAEAAQRKGEVDAYERNVERLKGMKYEGAKVLLDAFVADYSNSICYYYTFDADAWSGLGDEIDPVSGSGGGEALPPVEGRDLDPELAAALAKISPSKPAAKDAPLAKTESGAIAASKDGAVATGPSKLIVIAGISVILIAIAVALVFLL
ncbi:MAG: hypothetical protein RBU37_18720 [Myxococcota bacterium]|jgi:hypothetical protein|nr:hypothetical protein [Myxococcota bacterium]